MITDSEIQEMILDLEEAINYVDDNKVNKDLLRKEVDALEQMILEHKAHDANVECLLGMYETNKSLRSQRTRLIEIGRGMRHELSRPDCSPLHIQTLLNDWDALLKELESEK